MVDTYPSRVQLVLRSDESQRQARILNMFGRYRSKAVIERMDDFEDEQEFRQYRRWSRFENREKRESSSCKLSCILFRRTFSPTTETLTHPPSTTAHRAFSFLSCFFYDTLTLFLPRPIKRSFLKFRLEFPTYNVIASPMNFATFPKIYV